MHVFEAALGACYVESDVKMKFVYPVEMACLYSKVWKVMLWWCFSN